MVLLMTNTANTFTVGQTIFTDRVHGDTGMTSEARVIQIRSSDLVIEYTAPGIHRHDFQLVGRSFDKVRPA